MMPNTRAPDRSFGCFVREPQSVRSHSSLLRFNGEVERAARGQLSHRLRAGALLWSVRFRIPKSEIVRHGNDLSITLTLPDKTRVRLDKRSLRVQSVEPPQAPTFRYQRVTMTDERCPACAGLYA